jgi:hypothetical protein
MPAVNVSRERFNQLVVFLAAHPDIEVAEIEAALAMPTLPHPRSAAEVSRLFKDGVLTRRQALAAMGMEPPPAANTCAAPECGEDATIRQPFKLGRLALHIPLCDRHNAGWIQEAAVLNKSKQQATPRRSRWGGRGRRQKKTVAEAQPDWLFGAATEFMGQ